MCIRDRLDLEVEAIKGELQRDYQQLANQHADLYKEAKRVESEKYQAERELMELRNMIQRKVQFTQSDYQLVGLPKNVQSLPVDGVRQQQKEESAPIPTLKYYERASKDIVAVDMQVRRETSLEETSKMVPLNEIFFDVQQPAPAGGENANQTEPPPEVLRVEEGPKRVETVLPKQNQITFLPTAPAARFDDPASTYGIESILGKNGDLINRHANGVPLTVGLRVEAVGGSKTAGDEKSLRPLLEARTNDAPPAIRKDMIEPSPEGTFDRLDHMFTNYISSQSTN
eukprot:TRINITY_DN5538_c0_g1_i2.p1 TRINITY_DN5538_c0_g1~~TRINITY_DN5538_c0_g1_i2.p1  ORF type:complete len:285 (-),score=72.54 TRINITY_DN5538_c0_g1_i2:91-945(-)